MSRSRKTFVLYVAADEVKLVQVELRNGQVELSEACSFLSRAKTQDRHPLRDETTLDAIATHVSQHHWRGRDLLCLIGGSTVACQYYDMPTLNGPALRQAVMLKLKQQLHFDVADAVVAIDPMSVARGGEKPRCRVRVAAVHRDRASAAVDAAARMGLHITGISVAPAALAGLAQEAFKTAPGLTAILHVDEVLSTLVVLDEGSPCVTTELPIGLAELTAALMRPIIDGENVIQLDELHALELRNQIGIPAPDQHIESLGVAGQRLLPVIEPALQKFAKHLTQWLTFAATSVDGGKIQTVRLVGPGTAIPGFGPALAARINLDVRAENWLAGRASLTDSSPSFSLESAAAVVGAACCRDTLPDLLPSEVRTAYRIHQIRRSIVFCGPLLAAAVLAFAVLFQNVGAKLSPGISEQRRQLADVQQVLTENGRWTAEQKTIDRLQSQMDDFSTATPLWLGLFKELSFLLPAELQATEFIARNSEEGIRVTVNATVFVRHDGRSFDEVVERTLLLLQRSPFFRRVQLLAANRNEKTLLRGGAGTLSVELDLAYPRRGPKA
jgi:Tfp pilus assembly PilM family ATPase/Tfp pilus assembly protein PilN